MINFIIYDDNNEFTQIIKKIIEKIMFKRNEEYKIYIFNEYNLEFLKIIDLKIKNKIYILDIEVPKKSGLEISKKIREKDWDSVIIILTSHYELERMMYHSKLLILDFISKFQIYDKELIDLINLSLNKLKDNEILSIKIKNNIYKINLSEILYICYVSETRKTKIETLQNTFTFNKSLKMIKNELNSNFVYSHRNCIVNKSKIKEINYKSKQIIFNNNNIIELISRKYIGGLKWLTL